jgi:hypothetical protein
MQDVLAEGLRTGDIGIVVERNEVAGRETGYSIEFFDIRKVLGRLGMKGRRESASVGFSSGKR